jgi:hypothetical protein
MTTSVTAGMPIELNELKEIFGVGDCKNGKLRCANCKFNNFGEQREALGENCGIVLVANMVRQVIQNFRELDLEREAHMNRKSASNNPNLGIIF